MESNEKNHISCFIIINGCFYNWCYIPLKTIGLIKVLTGKKTTISIGKMTLVSLQSQRELNTLQAIAKLLQLTAKVQ